MTPARTAHVLRTLWTRLSGWWPWLVLALGVVLTWQQHGEAVENEQQWQQAQFDNRLKEMVLGLEQRLQSNTDVLRGVAGLFASSDQVDQAEFTTYVRGLHLADNYPGISGVGFSAWTTTPKPGHSSIIYLEPHHWRNQRALGYDMYADPVRAVAMRRAVETGQASVSGKVRLVQEADTDVQAGFLIYVPVYRKGRPLDTPAARWAALQGWAYSPVRAGDLVQNHLRRSHPLLEKEAVLTIHAGPTAEPGTLLYSTPQDQTNPARTGEVDTTLPLRVQGTLWLVQGHRRPTSIPSAWKPEVLWIGGLLTGLLALLVHVANRSHAQLAEALERTLAANAQLARNEGAMRLASRVMETSPLAIVVTDGQRRIVSVNPSFERITGHTAQAALGQDLSMLLTDRQAAERERLWTTLQQLGSVEGELDGRRRDGSLYPAAFTATQVHGDAAHSTQWVIIFQDITERRKADERIRHLAHHDHLTGLPNRAMLVDRATQALLAAQRYGLHPAVLFIDLDRFKPINDTHGHDAGDAVLIEVAQRLLNGLRETDLVCRQGGDEFVVLLPDHNSRQDLVDLAHKLLQAIEAPCLFNGLALQLGASIGVAMHPDHGTTVDELIQSADGAMYLAKGDAAQRVVVAAARAGATAT